MKYVFWTSKNICDFLKFRENIFFFTIFFQKQYSYKGSDVYDDILVGR